jgi:hypothetical protein
MSRKRQEYKRHEWRIVKAWSYADLEWKYYVQWKSKFLWFFTEWVTVDLYVVARCKWIDQSDPELYMKVPLSSGSSRVYFDSEDAARRFIEFFESYRKRMCDVKNDMEFNKYIYL